MKQKEIPVLLITGYLGSGKTTLLNNILANREGTRYAVIVNDIGEVNIDAELIQKGGVVGGSGSDDLVALQNGCICCSLRMDLVNQLTELIDTGKFDAIVIEASGICEPAPIAQTICSIPAMGEEYHRNGIPRLQSIITVVDALRMRDEFGCGADLTAHKHSSGEEDIESLVIEQIEFCNVILLNKISEITDEEAAQLRQVIRALQPHARIIECDYAEVPLSVLDGGDDFNFESVATSAGWISHLESTPTDREEEEAHNPHHHEHHEHEHHHDHHDHHHEHPEGCTCGHCHDHGGDHDGEHAHCGIETMVYYRRPAFDIHKFDRLVATQWPANVIRTKGVIYFAHNRDMSYLFEQAGRQKKLTEAGFWYATAPEEELMAMMAREPGLRRDWDPEYGDRMVKLVFIGRNLDRAALTAALDECLCI